MHLQGELLDPGELTNVNYQSKPRSPRPFTYHLHIWTPRGL